MRRQSSFCCGQRRQNPRQRCRASDCGMAGWLLASDARIKSDSRGDCEATQSQAKAQATCGVFSWAAPPWAVQWAWRGVQCSAMPLAALIACYRGACWHSLTLACLLACLLACCWLAGLLLLWAPPQFRPFPPRRRVTFVTCARDCRCRCPLAAVVTAFSLGSGLHAARSLAWLLDCKVAIF